MRTSRLHQVPDGANEVHRHDAANDEQLWVVCVGAGQLHLVQGIDALRELIAKHALTMTARIYALSATSRVLGEVPELKAAFDSRSDAGPTTSETEPEAAPAEPVAAPAELSVAPAKPAVETAGPSLTATKAAAEDAEAARSNHALDDDFSLLDRPFDDGDYFEEPHGARWLRAAGMAALLLLLGGGGYRLVHSWSATRSPAVAMAAPPSAKPPVVVPAPVAAAAAPVAEAPVAAPAATVVEPPVAVTAPVPAPAAPAPVAAPAGRPMGAPSSSYSELVAAGHHQFEAGHSRNAQALFERALAETPDGTAALVGLAYVHLDQGRVRQAITLFQRAVAQDHGEPMAVFGLAECHRQEGNRRAALDEFKTFLTLQSTGSDADIARRLVEELANGG
jgi:tetratricopeptide (TPR) repeat protein